MGARLNIAFIVTIAVMAVCHIAITFFINFFDSQNNLAKAFKQFGSDSDAVAQYDGNITQALLSDPAVMDAFNTSDRQACQTALRNFIARQGFNGFIAFFDRDGRLFYSSETPAKYGESLRESSPLLAIAIQQHSKQTGCTILSPAGTMSLSIITPIQNGFASVNQPLTSEYFSGLSTKMGLSRDPVKGVDLVLVSTDSGKVVAASSQIMSDKGSVIQSIDQHGGNALPSDFFPADGRFWRKTPMPSGNKIVGLLLIGVSAKPFTAAVRNAILIDIFCGIVALALAFVFAARMSNYVSRSLSYLIKRVNDLSKQKANLDPLDKLDGPFYELAELMDSSVSSMRSSIQSLRLQVSRHAMEIEDKTREVESISSQLNNLNRSVSGQSGQLVDVNRQINFANQQTAIVSQRLNAVMQVANEGFLILDAYGKLLSANPTFLNWTGSPENELAGRLYFDLVKAPGEIPDGNKNPSSEGLTPEELISRFSAEGLIYNSKTNKVTEVLAHLQPVVTDETQLHGYVLVLRDRSLRNEVAHLRTEIVHMLTDSIRAPLTAVEPVWNNLLTQSSKGLTPQAGQSLAELHSHYRQVIGVTDSLLMMYGGFTPPPSAPRESIVVTKLIADCLQNSPDLAKEKNLAIDYKTMTGLPTITGNKDALHDVITQLLRYVTEITEAGGKIRVESKVAGSDVRIAVSSSGPPLNQTDLNELFDGYIAGKHAENTYITRLKLYLCRNNIERMGGRIWAETIPDKGTIIHFTVPING